MVRPLKVVIASAPSWHIAMPPGGGVHSIAQGALRAWRLEDGPDGAAVATSRPTRTGSGRRSTSAGALRPDPFGGNRIAGIQPTSLLTSMPAAGSQSAASCHSGRLHGRCARSRAARMPTQRHHDLSTIVHGDYIVITRHASMATGWKHDSSRSATHAEFVFRRRFCGRRGWVLDFGCVSSIRACSSNPLTTRGLDGPMRPASWE